MPNPTLPLLQVPYFDAKRQYETLQSEIKTAVETVLKSGQFILGEPLREFEQDFAAFCGTRFSLGVASGTDALTIAFKVLGIGPGDEVLVPSFTYSATVFGILHNRATPVFCEVNPTTYTLDVESAAQRVTRKTKAVLPVHLYGQCANMDAIIKFAKAHKLKIVEDAAQAHGARWREQKAGSFGHAGCFSFYPTKNLGAYGDGGAITCSDAKIMEKIRNYRNLGHTEAALPHVDLGWTSRLDNLQAAILRIKLKHLERLNELRRKAATRYFSNLRGLPLLLPQADDRAYHVYHVFIIQAEAKVRDSLRLFLQEKGVPTLLHYKLPCHRQPFVRKSGLAKVKLPVTDRLAGRILSLPIFPEIKESEIDFICDQIRAFYRS